MSIMFSTASKQVLRGLDKFRLLKTAKITEPSFRYLPSCCVAQSYRSQYLHTTNIFQDTFHIQDEEDFNRRVLNSKKPVVVQFHATWCAPCKMLSPRMETSIAATKDAIDLAQVDIDDNPDIAMSYSVGAVPAVMAIKDGKVVDKFIGLKDEDQVDSFVAKLLKC